MGLSRGSGGLSRLLRRGAGKMSTGATGMVEFAETDVANGEVVLRSCGDCMRYVPNASSNTEHGKLWLSNFRLIFVADGEQRPVRRSNPASLSCSLLLSAAARPAARVPR